MSRNNPIEAAFFLRVRHLLLCALLATPLSTFATSNLAADDEYAAAVHTISAQSFALSSNAVVAYEFKQPSDKLPPAAATATSASPDAKNHVLTLACLIAVAAFMAFRHRD
jgi:hypothetical protein